MIPLPISTGFYQDDSLPLAAQECSNVYVENPQVAALSDLVLKGVPGLSSIGTTGEIQQINRGAHEFEKQAYFVNGTNLYRLTRTVVEGQEGFTIDNKGTIEGSGRLTMVNNGTQMMILVPGGKGYIFTTGSPDTLVEITDLDFTANGQPQYAVFIDGYFVCSTDSKKFIASDLNDGTSWNALDFGSAEANPDEIVAPIAYKNQLFIAGSITTEGFQNIGGAQFPFQRNGIFIEKGLSAPFAVSTASDAFLFIGAGQNEEPAVWQYSGGDSPNKVSTYAIDQKIQALTDEELALTFAWSTGEKGHYFVGFTSPSWCYVYDLATGLWHERKSFIDGADSRFRPNSFIQAYGRIWCGDSKDGRIGELSTSIYTEYGALIRRRWVTQPFSNQGLSFSIPALELTVESGLGDSDTPDPKVAIEISKDGKTWGQQRIRSIGKVGEYRRRVRWRRLGDMERFVYLRFTFTEMVRAAFIKLEADIEA